MIWFSLFIVLICTDSIVPLFTTVSTKSFQLSEAESYMKKAHEIINDHITKSFELEKSIVSVLRRHFYERFYKDNDSRKQF